MVKNLWEMAAMLAASLGAWAASGCAPDDPFDFGGPRSCELADQNEWVYGLMQEAYLFADDLPSIDPSEYETPHEMVSDLRVPPDRWSRVSDKAKTEALYEEGKSVGTGLRTRRDDQDRVVVAEVLLDSPAAAAGIERGDIVTMVGGLTTEQIDEQGRWSDIYGENVPGVSFDLEVETPSGELRAETITKDWIAINTVPVTAIHRIHGRPVGYLQFATFVDTAKDQLNAAFAEFRAAGVREVVIDLRYNGGGLISVARHFMHLLVGGIAQGETAYRVVYNDTFADENDERALERLSNSLSEVDHVVFITTGSSASASELVINAVAAHVPVSIVGSTTGGKPVGSRGFDLCDSVVQPITFRLVNADDFGDYYEGMEPDCPASDDLSHRLGDAEEGSLAVALERATTGQCIGDPTGEAATGGPPAGLRARGESDLDPQPGMVARPRSDP